MSKISEAFEEDEFRVVRTTVNGIPAKFIVDKTETLYCKLEASKIQDAEDFTETLLEYDEEFEKVFYLSRTDNEENYLYEVYL